MLPTASELIIYDENIQTQNNMTPLLIKATKIIPICLIVPLLVSFSIHQSSSNQLSFGVFDDGRLVIAKHDSLRVVTGVINAKEYDVSCKLYFYSTYSAINNGLVKIYNPLDNQVYNGRLSGDKNGTVNIKMDRVIFPCQRIMDLTGGELFTLTRSITANIYLGMVKVPRAFLYESPTKLTSKKSFLISGDIVAIKQRLNGWMKISYLNNPSLIKWVKCQDLKFAE